MNTIRRERGRRRAGFSLAELMVVIVIIGLLATLVVPNVVERLFTASAGKAKADIMRIEQALDEYAVDHAGKYPESLQELVTPNEFGSTYLKGDSIPLDPWKNEYGYEPPGPGNPKGARVFTFGADGVPGGEGKDADIDNFMVRRGDV